MTLPIYFAWVTETDTTFTSGMRRMDEDIFAFTRTLSENGFPILSITIRNPRRGLLNGNTWAWLVYNGSGTEVPLFFGRIQGLPDELDKETITVKLLARSKRWRTLKQAVAEALKQEDGYDPIFVDAGSRDDPDAIVEGFSGSYCYDAVPSGSPADLQISFSDMLEPEDGTVDFAADEILYDGVTFKIGEQPLVLGGVRASVQWTQRAAGSIDMGATKFGTAGGPVAQVTPSGFVTGYSGGNAVTTAARSPYSQAISVVGDKSLDKVCWTGGAIVDSWPKPGTKLAGGYSVVASAAIGNGAQFGSPQQHNFKWENQEEDHNDGDIMSQDATWTTYPCGGELFLYDVFKQPGFVNPWGRLTFNGPEGINIPLHVTYSETLVCAWVVNTNLVLDYEAARPHNEVLEFRLTADVQAVLSDPSNPASLDSEIQIVPGADVGAPIINVLSWYTLFLQGNVRVGQIVKSTPEVAGQSIYSIAVHVTAPGNVGASEPTWTDVLGATLTDGNITWASLGFTLPGDFPAWNNVANSDVIRGTIIRAETFLAAAVDWVGVPFPASPAGTQSFQICTTAGHTLQYSNGTFTGIADTQPSYPQPHFSPTAGVTTTDGTAVWTSLGDGLPVMELPLGLNPSQNCYFPTDRGAQSIRALILRERAKMRARARAVTTGWESPFEKVMGLTLRMGCRPFDDRLPGGSLVGKIIKTELMMTEGQPPLGRVTVASALGVGGSGASPLVDGDYGDVDYDDGYQIGVGLGETTTGADVYYSLPVAGPDSDGVTFPIMDRSQVIVKEAVIVGRPPGAAQFVPNSYITIKSTITLPAGYGGYQNEFTDYVAVPVGYTPVLIPLDYSILNTGIKIATQSLYYFPTMQYYVELKPLDGFSFAKQYNIQTSELVIPYQVNTEAASLP